MSRPTDEDPFVVLAASPRGWAAQLHAHAADHGGVVVRATVLTEADARAEDCDVLVVDDITSFLTPALVRSAHEAGRSVLGVYDPEDSRGKGDLVDLDVDGLVSAEADAEELVSTIRGLARNPGHHTDLVPPSAAPAHLGRRIGVVGPPGGVGVTELAVEVAAAVATRGQRTILLDADESAPAHAQRLGLPLHPNVLGAIDAERRGTDVMAGLHPLARRHRLASLPGMAVDADWAHVPQGSLRTLSERLAAGCDALVADLGVAPAWVEGPAGARFGHALDLARACDDLLMVCLPTPVSIARILRLRSRLVDAQRVHVVLNRVPRDRFIGRHAVAELRHGLAVEEVHTIAEDPRVAHAAWQGERVARGVFAKDVAAMIRTLGWAER